jgi:hypothetical protein
MLFGIDDSEIVVEGRPHTIRAAFGCRSSAKVETVETALEALKMQFGLTPADEVKWNGMKPMPKLAREALSQELMLRLQESVPLISINEGRDKQHTAEQLACQISACLGANPYSLRLGETIELVFDEHILGDLPDYSRFLQSLSPSPVASAMVVCNQSNQSAAIQLADVLAGFNRLATEIALGRENKQILVPDDALDGDVAIDLLSYISLALRWEMWGEVPIPRSIPRAEMQSRRDDKKYREEA